MTAPRIQAALNGARAAGFHPALPLSPGALADAARACGLAGAFGVHLHARDALGEETLAPGAIAEAVAAVRAAAPGLSVSVSTGDWIEQDNARQLAHVTAWGALPAGARPDEASVNLGEATAPAVIAALRAGGIGVEAGLAHVADAQRLVALGLGGACRRILVEIDDREEAEAWGEAAAILAVLDRAGLRVERLLHGFGRSVWPMARRAAWLGLSLRVGFEDGAELPEGGPAPDNAALVAAAVRSCSR